MIASKLLHAVPAAAFVVGVSRQASTSTNIVFKLKCIPVATKFNGQLVQQARNYARGSFQNATTQQRQTVRKSLKDRLMGPTTGTPFAAGRMGLAAAAGVGIGALCFYGLGLSNQPGTLEMSQLWPQFVKDRIHATYRYFGGSLILTAASAVAISRNPTLMRFFSSGGIMPLMASLALMIGTGMVARSIPYEPNSIFGAKQMAWMLHCATLGGVVAPLTILGGQLMVRACMYTAGIVGGLSAVAVCAPSEKFLNMAGPLSIGMGVVFVSSLGTWFVAPGTALGAGLYSIAMYGGLVLFSGFLLYDTQKIIKMAEGYPMYAAAPYDPVNSCMGIYMDTMNIFIRVAMLLAGGGNRRK